MPRNGKTESSTVHTGDSSFVSLLSGWVQQGVENFFATQRILVDLAMTQNANAMSMVRSRFKDPEFCPAEVASELAGEAMTNFIEGQKLLLEPGAERARNRNRRREGAGCRLHDRPLPPPNLPSAASTASSKCSRTSSRWPASKPTPG